MRRQLCKRQVKKKLLSMSGRSDEGARPVLVADAASSAVGESEDVVVQVAALPVRLRVDVEEGAHFGTIIRNGIWSLKTGNRGAEGDCMNPYTPPPGADPGNKKCSCTGGCAMSMYIGSSCGCASLGVGCSDACQCRGQCSNGHR